MALNLLAYVTNVHYQVMLMTLIADAIIRERVLSLGRLNLSAIEAPSPVALSPDNEEIATTTPRSSA
jgi:hypothetical protein